MQTIKRWTRFQGRPKGYLRGHGLSVKLSPRGEQYLNKAAWEAINCSSAVELLYDKNRHIIGISPIEAWHETSFPVISRTGTTGKLTRINPFVSHFQLRSNRTVIFNDAYIDDEGILALPLESITAINRGSR